MNDEVMDFIGRFRKLSKHNDITVVFTCGCCYWFAYILTGRFDGATIMYDPIANHFVTQIEDRLFDITGDVTDYYSGNVVPWDTYDDDIEKKRIIRDCVNFTD